MPNRARILLAIGIGATALVCIAGIAYQIYHGQDGEKTARPTISMQSLPGDGQGGEGEEEGEDEGEEEEFHDPEEEKVMAELPCLSAEQLRNYKTLLGGEIDAAQLVDEQGIAHDVLVQYASHGKPAGATCDDNRMPLFECRQLGRPVGRLEFDDGSVAIVYKGDAAFVLFGHGDRADRIALVVNILSQVLTGLKCLMRHRATISVDVLMKSIAVNAAGKARLLGLHAIHFRGSSESMAVQTATVDAFKLLAKEVLKHGDRCVQTEREQARKLARELATCTNINAIEKKLAQYGGGGNGHRH